MDTLMTCLRDLVIANRILAREGVVDAFGHISVRHPENPDHFLLSRSRAPELITRDDILEFTLDGEPAVDLKGRTPYGERFIHAAVLEARPDVNSVVHNHSQEVIPFAVTRTTPLRAIAHACAPIGADIPTWDIRDKFDGGDMLVVNIDQGRDLARALGGNTSALMRGHGCVVVGRNIKEAVNAAVYLQVNARLQMHALQLGEPIYLTPAEIEAMTARQMSPLAMDRTWEYWVMRAGCGDL
jgi:HCOMODA/2-hydroxy-3-carboxy-muconic semialdehyde decarboxylase